MSAETPAWIEKLAKRRGFRIVFKAFVVIIVAVEAYLFLRSARTQQHLFFDSAYQNGLALALILVMLVGIYVTSKKNRR